MKIEHFALYVRDLEGTKDFFIKYFDGKAGNKYHNPKTGFSSYFISFSCGARLEIMESPLHTEVPRGNLLGFAHLAFSLGSKEKVDELTERLQADGYKLLSGPRTTGDGYYESCFSDSEGNQIEITV